jgi:hypothetical protein
VARPTATLVLARLTIAGVKTNDMKANGRERARQTGMRGKVTRRGTLGGYEVTGWRYPEETSWHVKVWPVGRPRSWIGYTVAAGIFELRIVAQAHKEAVLQVIGEWETEKLKPKPRRGLRRPPVVTESKTLPDSYDIARPVYGRAQPHGRGSI